MKTLESKPVAPKEPTEADIRQFAEHLFERSGRIPGRDLHNWLEAKAVLTPKIPPHQSNRRPPRQAGAERSELRTDEPQAEPTFDPLADSDRSSRIGGTVVLHHLTARPGKSESRERPHATAR